MPQFHSSPFFWALLSAAPTFKRDLNFCQLKKQVLCTPEKSISKKVHST